jgi:hypothetical protein
MIPMRGRSVVLVLGVLPLLAVLACWSGDKIPAVTSLAFDSGNCAGCLLGADDGLDSFVVRTDADYESLTAKCDGIRSEWLPPRPAREQVLVYVSRQDSGCKGCLDIVNIRETRRETVVEVEGGFQGACEMLITLGAWALVPKTQKPVTFKFREVLCPDDE